MTSKVISDLKRRGRPALTVAIGVGNKPGGQPDAGPAGPADLQGVPPPEGGDQEAQSNYQQGMEALQALADKWPKFAPVLQQFQKVWADYQQGMGGGPGPGGPGASAGSAAEQAAAKQE